MLTGNGPAAGDTLWERPGGEYRLSGLRRRSDRLGARVAALAEAGEVLVSSTVKDLVNDSGIAFQERAPTCSRAYPGSGSCSRRQATWRPSLTTFRSSW